MKAISMPTVDKYKTAFIDSETFLTCLMRLVRYILYIIWSCLSISYALL